MAQALLRQLAYFPKEDYHEIYKEHTQIAILTIGGNNMLDGLLRDFDNKIVQFKEVLINFLTKIGMKVLIASVYDPTLNDDNLDFMGIDPKMARENHKKVNELLEKLGNKYICTSKFTYYLNRSNIQSF